MQLTTAHVERLRDYVRAEPLEAGEIRRVRWAGEQYIALSSVTVDTETYTQMYALSVDGESITIYAKINTSSAVSAG